MANDWQFSKTNGKCNATGRELAEGDEYYAVLFERPEGLERVDYSVENWAGQPEGSFCYWRGRIPFKQQKPENVKIDSELLKDLFCRLEDDESEIKQQFRFVLALLLMRKRLLKLQKTIRQDECEYWQVVLANDQAEHKVLNPNLTAEQIERLSAQLTAILSGDVAALDSLEQQDATTEDQPDPTADDAETSSVDEDDNDKDTDANDCEPESEGPIATS